MANYQGLACIMGEITTMVSNARPPHDQHIYEYFYTMEKYVSTAVPQIFLDCMEGFREQLIIEFETYFNGEKMHHDQIAQAIGDILDKSIFPYLITLYFSVSFTIFFNLLWLWLNYDQYNY